MLRSASRTICSALVFACTFAYIAHEVSRVDAQMEAHFARVCDAARADLAAGGMPGIAVAIVLDGRIALSEGFGLANIETSATVTPDALFRTSGTRSSASPQRKRPGSNVPT